MSIPRNLAAAACLILTVQVFGACTNVKGSAPAGRYAPAASVYVEPERVAEVSLAELEEASGSIAAQEPPVRDPLVRADSRYGMRSFLGRYDLDRNGRLDDAEILKAQASMQTAQEGEGLPEVGPPHLRRPASSAAPSAGDLDRKRFMASRRRSQTLYKQLDGAAGLGKGKGKGRGAGAGGRRRRR